MRELFLAIEYEAAFCIKGGWTRSIPWATEKGRRRFLKRYHGERARMVDWNYANGRNRERIWS